MATRYKYPDDQASPFATPDAGIKPVAPGARPTTGVQAFNPSEALSPSNRLNELAAQMDPRLVAIREKNQLRHMTPLQQAQQTDRIVMQNAASLGDTTQSNRISLANNVGPTLDQNYVNNRPYLAPESKAVIRSARTQFNKEITDLLSGSNKARWTTLQDYEDAVNALPSVQKYGSLIEDHVTSVARRLLSPSMKAEFDANDKNTQAFIQWAKQNPNMAYLANLGDAALADQYHNNPELRKKFDEDPNALKYDVTPDGKIQQRQTTPGQQSDLVLQTKLRSDEQQFQANYQRSQKFLQDNPEEAKAFRINPNSGELEERPKSAADLVADSVAKEKLTLNERVKQGLASPDEQQKLTRTELATTYAQQGFPIPKVGEKVVLPNEPGYDALVEAFDPNRPNVKLSKVEEKNLEQLGGVSYRLKKNVDAFDPTAENPDPFSGGQPSDTSPEGLSPDQIKQKIRDANPGKTDAELRPLFTRYGA